MHFKISSAKWRPFCLDLNVLTLSLMLRLAYSTRTTSKHCRWCPGPLRRQDLSSHGTDYTWGYTYLRCRDFMENANTVESLSNAVQYIMLFHRTLQWLKSNINQNLNPQKTPHTERTLTGKLWGVVSEGLGENWSRYNGTALYMFIFLI